MAQLADLVRAKALLRRAARAFDPKEAVARARCVVAEAEIALVSRDLGWPAKALDTARATLEAHADRANAAHARYLKVRRLLLIGRIDEAERALAELDPVPLPPAHRTAHELVVAGIAIRRLRTKEARDALARAKCAARDAGIPALAAEVEVASDLLNTPAARLITRGNERVLRLEQVEALLAAKVLVVDACRHVVRRASKVVSLTSAQCCSRSCARWPRCGPKTCRETCSWRGHSEQSASMNRIGAFAGRSRAAAHGASDAGRCERDEARLRAGTAPRTQGDRAGPAHRGGACTGACLPRRRRIVVELGPCARACNGPAHRAAGARFACGSRQGAVVRSRASSSLDDRARAGIHDNIVTPYSIGRVTKDGSMNQSAVEIVREYGPFPGVDHVHGVTYDGRHVWFAAGDRLNAFDPATGKPLRSIDVAANAGTAFDGQHLVQLAAGSHPEDRPEERPLC